MGKATKSAFGVLFSLVLVYLSVAYALPDVKPTLDAVRGKGDPGVFRVESQRRDAETGACGWEGTFTSRDGRVRHGVSYTGETSCGSVEGERFPARDTGARDAVFGGEKTSAGELISPVVFSLPVLLALLVPLAMLALSLLFLLTSLVLWAVSRLRGSRGDREDIPIQGRSIRELQDDPRLTAAQQEMLRPRPRVAEPPPGWTPGPPLGPSREEPDR